MFENEDQNNFKDIESLKAAFQKMKKGQSHRALHEDDFEALIDHFEVYGDKENWQIACEMSTEIFPFSTALLMRKAEWLLAQNKSELALSLMEKIKNITPGDLDSLLLHAEVLVECDKVDDAIQLLKGDLEKFADADKAFILMELAEIYDEQTEFEKVYSTLKQVLEINPLFEDALVRMCFWADVTKKQDDCIVFHKEILEKYPLYASAWYNIGLLYQSIKNFPEAIESYENCLAVNSKFEYAMRNLGECFIQIKEYDNAIAILEEHIHVAKTEDVILETLAFCWEHKKQYAKARHYYRKASIINPEDDTIFYKIGETYVKERAWEKAVKSFSVALHIDQGNATYSLALGDCLLELESEEEAIVCYLNAIKQQPNEPAIWDALIKALYSFDYLEEALQQTEIAIEHCGDRVEFEYYRAGIYLALGKTKDAVLFFENALIMDTPKAKCLNKIDKDILLHPIFSDLLLRYKK